MRIKSIYILSIVTLLLAAFTGPAFAAPARLTSSASLSTSTSTVSASITPQPGDDKLIRDVVFMNFAKSRLLVSATRPVQVQAVLTGNLPDACHVLRVAIGPTSTTRSINISVYSLFKAGSACAAVLQPFSVTVPLGSFSSGTYSVFVNGTLLGTFSAGGTITSLG